MPGGDHCNSCTAFKKTKNRNQRKYAAQVQEGQGCTPECPSVPLSPCCVPGVNSARTLHLFCPHPLAELLMMNPDERSAVPTIPSKIHKTCSQGLLA